ncbi:MAG: DUF5721 family protein [Hespellia sp.]|nr:DUF5721 family protein [Hespellia sp.]
MIAINLPNAKNCMAHLLLNTTFDSFLFIEGEIVTANTFTIDGFIQKKFYRNGATDSPDSSFEDTSIPDYTLWKDIRDYAFSIIKGKRTPLSFKFIYSASPEDIQTIITSSALDIMPGDVQGLYLNIKFDGEHLLCITGTSFKSFSLDKTLERAWDAHVQLFFEEAGVAFETIDGQIFI